MITSNSATTRFMFNDLQTPLSLFSDREEMEGERRNTYKLAWDKRNFNYDLEIHKRTNNINLKEI